MEGYDGYPFHLLLGKGREKSRGEGIGEGVDSGVSLSLTSWGGKGEE